MGNNDAALSLSLLARPMQFQQSSKGLRIALAMRECCLSVKIVRIIHDMDLQETARSGFQPEKPVVWDASCCWVLFRNTAIAWRVISLAH